MMEMGASVLWTSLATAAQPSLAVRRIGLLSPGPPLTPAQLREAWQPLRDIGWIEGENVIFERRWANGNAELLKPLAEELVRLNVELIATIGMPATLAAKNATARIPIVMLSSRAWLDPEAMSPDTRRLHRNSRTNALRSCARWRPRRSASGCCSILPTISGISLASSTSVRARRLASNPSLLKRPQQSS